MIAEQIRVVIVDDSLIARELIKKILETDTQVKVVGEAKNGKEAIEMVAALRPNIVTLDLRMPVMDGFEAIEQIMAFNPTPILVITATSFEKKQEIIFEALTLGALDIVAKPSPEMWADFPRVAAELIKKVKMLSSIPVITHLKGRNRGLGRIYISKKVEAFKVIAIGASTGGPRAILRILNRLPEDFPAGIVIVQHIAPGFIKEMVKWLDKNCKISVKLAKEGEKIVPGQALVAPNDLHLFVKEKRRIELAKTLPVGGHRPSVNVLFSSVASVYKSNAIGVILTGMGKDGVEGMKDIRDMGGQTIAQDEESCVVFGMPKVTIERVGVDKIVPLEVIAEEIIKML